MSNIPPLNYFMEQEQARAATKNFQLILQEAFNEYKKVWSMYINLVKKCEDNNSRSFSKDKTEVRQKGGNYKSVENMYIDEPDINSVHSIDDVLVQCTLDLNSSIEELNKDDQSEKIRKAIVPGSPIFRRNNVNSATSALRRSNSISSLTKSIIANDNLGEDNKQENSDQVHSVINASSTTNVPSVFLCSTPTKSQKWSNSKKQNVKRSPQLKRTILPNSLKKKNNLIRIRKETTSKAPLQIINNVASVSKIIHQMDKNNSNKSYNIQVTMSPTSRKLKQTKLVFHKTKRTIELSNNLKSPNVPQASKTKMPISDRDKILRQNTLTDSTSLKEKETNNEHIANTYNRVEVSKGSMKHNFAYIPTNPQIKNEVIFQQEYEQNNMTEINDSLNTSNESDSTFFEENECNIRSNKNNDTGFDSDETCVSPMKNKCKSTNENREKRHINSLETEQNIVEIDDIEEPIKKKRLSKLENGKCNECKRNGKKHCLHHKSIPNGGRNISTISSTLLADSPSSTT